MLVTSDVGEPCSYAELCLTVLPLSTAFDEWTVSGSLSIDARFGFSVAIPCTPPQASPAPHVVWQADGVEIAAGDPLNGSNDDRIQVLPSGHLVIHDLGASDFAVAQYRCSVRNVRTHSTSDSPQTVTLVKGTNCLKCAVSCTVLPTVWLHCTLPMHWSQVCFGPVSRYKIIYSNLSIGS